MITTTVSKKASQGKVHVEQVCAWHVDFAMQLGMDEKRTTMSVSQNNMFPQFLDLPTRLGPFHGLDSSVATVVLSGTISKVCWSCELERGTDLEIH